MSNSNTKTAILTVATGKYFGFLNQLLSGIETNNSSASEITVFVFTDETKEITNTKLNVVKVFWDKTNWPDPTLLRYHGFLLIENDLAKYDQILYLDVDMQVKSQLPLAISQKLLAIQHPGYLKVKNAQFEENTNSLSYLKPAERKIYVCGGVQGGGSEVYLTAIKQIKKWIDADLENGIVARWHDESYWNKYVNQNMEQTVILGREYCWPEQWVTSNNPGKIIALKKNHTATRNNYSFKSKVRFLLSEVRMKLLRPRTY